MGSMNEARTARRYAQRICAVLLALAIALWSMALPLGSITQAYADDGYTITIEDATSGTYSAYQILTGTYTSSGALGGDAAVNSSIQTALLAALTATGSDYTVTIAETTDTTTYSSGKTITFYDYDNLDSDGKASSTTVDYTDYALAYAVMCQLEEIDSDGLAATFANNLAAQVSINSVAATATATASDGTATISVSATGYYLVTQTGSSTTNTSPILLAVTSSGGTATQKSATEPTASKTVTTDSSTGAAITYNEDGTASITYSIEGTVASDIEDYSTYSYSFVDTLPAGITISSSTSSTSSISYSVSIGSTDATSNFSMTSTGTSDSDGVTTTTVTWSCSDILSVSGASVSSGTKIILTYTLTICASELSVITSASESDTGALVNTAYVTYSNDPNGNGTGSSSESTTEADINLYNLVVYKVDDESKALAGATFSLTASNGYSQSGTVAESTDSNGNTVYCYTFTALELGVTYTLSETTVPDGYKQIQDVTFYLGETTQTSTDVSSTVTLPSVTETSDLSQCATFVTDSNDDNTVTVTITNNPGNTLPTTGLSGRTLALLAGLLLIVVCAGLLLTRRRKVGAQQ